MSYEICNGTTSLGKNWIPATPDDLAAAAARNRISYEELIALLDAGRQVSWDDEWYALVRRPPAPRPLYNVDADSDAAKLAGEDY